MNKLDKEIKRFNRITTLIFVIFSLLIVVLVYFFSRAHLVMTVVPKDAIVTVDNFPLKINRLGKSSIYTSPGNHTIKVEADGYLGVSKEVFFRRGLTTNVDINLKEMPEQVLIEKSGTFLNKGKSSNEFLYLDESKSQLYKSTLKLDTDNKVKVEKMAITSKRLSNINEIIWSPNNDLALFRIGDRIDLFDFQRYDFINQTQKEWGRNIGSIAWRPDNSKIAYFYQPPTGERSLILSNMDNSEANRLINFKEIGVEIENPLLRWSPDSRWLVLIPQSKQYDKNKIYLVDTYTRQLKTLTDFGDQLDAKFSPDSTQILYSTYSLDVNGNSPHSISIMNQSGQNQRSLNIRADLTKVIWRSNSKEIILSTQDAITKTEYISIIDVNDSKKHMDSLILPRDQKLKLLQISSDDKIIVYQTDKGIYASRLEE